MAVEELRDDCDGDALLVRVRPNGPACHTGSLSCFAPALWRTISERAATRPEGSYTTKLLDEGTPACAQKVGEEAVEVVRAALVETDERLVAEAADSSTTCTCCSPRAASTSPRSRTSSARAAPTLIAAQLARACRDRPLEPCRRGTGPQESRRAAVPDDGRSMRYRVAERMSRACWTHGSRRADARGRSSAGVAAS